jgi:putative membrane protein
MMHYDNYHFGGMHLIWWFVWVFFVIWIFAMPFDIPGRRYKGETSLEMLKKRFVSGEISLEEYQQKKKLL